MPLPYDLHFNYTTLNLESFKGVFKRNERNFTGLFSVKLKTRLRHHSKKKPVLNTVLPRVRLSSWFPAALLITNSKRATIQLNVIHNNRNVTDRGTHWAELFSRVTFVSDRSHNRVTVLRQTLFKFW